MKGGYVMINLTSSRLFKEINEAMTLDKPYLIYGDDIPYFADSITYDADTTTYTIAKGGQLIVIDSENNITKTGDKDGALLSSIVDDAGNQRFIDIEGTPVELTGFTASYCKASLSGTHLMFVLAGTIEAGTTIASDTANATFTIPSWVGEKIYPVYWSNIEYKSVPTYSLDQGQQSSIDMRCFKQNDTTIVIAQTSAFTPTYDVEFRIQFDLLIDSE